MQAVILAAGMGKRLKDLTYDNTKCMVKVNNVALIDRMLHQLENLHLSRIVIVVGYKGQKLIDYINTLNISTPILFINNPIYNKTNNIYSLMLAKDYLIKEDTILLESDLIFEDSVLKILMDDPRETIALVDKYESWMDGTCVKIKEDDSIEAFIPGKKFVFEDIPEYYKTVNIYKFSRHFLITHYVPFLEAYSMALGNNEYYEQVLRVIALLDEPEIKVKKLDGQLWYEIDDIQDLDIAASMFATDDEKVTLISSRYGGYWRYPKLVDFSYPTNPWFPPQKLMDEIKANFEPLLIHQPSSVEVNSLLASKNFGIQQKHIMVGNDVVELIKSLLEEIRGKIGYVQSAFMEYPNCHDDSKSVIFVPDNADFTYTVDDLTQFFESKDINTLILTNPDNLSGNYVPYSGIMILVNWAKSRKINIVIDETFTDFADTYETNSLMVEDFLALYDRLYVVKSISESYGVPGLRLGVLASSNTETITRLKKCVPIWNINSVAEFYLQIYEKYEKDYRISLEKIIQSRKQMMKLLEKVPYLRAMPTQANYICCEVLYGMKSSELAKQLLEKGILIKCFTSKISNGREYIKVTVRTEKENEQLIEALMAMQGGISRQQEEDDESD
ncbi:MAG: aminotransferase class I/II-fold pyridoxal phosphate-dependent enzyme [Lachnospiraceae bacterium]|nr:aminotransferase class I/II-fold pyridoxal phosphate-dependent enzyme [Lachnospiraceae bacterium]